MSVFRCVRRRKKLVGRKEKGCQLRAVDTRLISILFICHLTLQDTDFTLFSHKSKLLPLHSIGPKVWPPGLGLFQLLIDPP